jgi:hypothetical protein
MASDNGMAINSLIGFSSVLNDNDIKVFFGNSTEKFAGKMKSISGACAYPYLKSYTKKTGADEGVRQKIRVDY